MAIVIVLMALDYPVGTWTLISLLFVIPLLIVGWFVVRDRVNEIARVREGFTGTVPVIAAPPMARKLSNEGVYKNYFTELAEHDDDSDEDRK
jgi:L-asparagine permease